MVEEVVITRLVAWSCVSMCRCKDSVKHFPVEFDGGNILFGKGVFSTWGEFLQHFNEKPLIGGGDSGMVKKY